MTQGGGIAGDATGGIHRRGVLIRVRDRVRAFSRLHSREARERRRWMPFTSTLTGRILVVNLLAPILLVAGLFYLDRYQEGLIDTELNSLQIRAEIFAAALGEGAVLHEGYDLPHLAAGPARAMLHRLARPAGVRARLFLPDGSLTADTRVMARRAGEIQSEPLPPPPTGMETFLHHLYLHLSFWNPSEHKFQPYWENQDQRAIDYPEVSDALMGGTARAVRRVGDHGHILSVALPVQYYKDVVGAIMLTTNGTELERNLYEVRLAIIQVFGVTLLVTVALSLYLAGVIARPIRRLAQAADHVRRGHGRHHHIPDLSDRGDEIGDLSAALRDMTAALWRRMDAIEAFAADVAHEIKNPLTSLRSAVETAGRLTDPERQKKLLAVIQDDVKRLDRLITDISDASRLDAELSRAESEPVDLRRMLDTLADVYRTTGQTDDEDEAKTHFHLDLAAEDSLEGNLAVPGLEGRLVQVFRNLIGNALSFSPPGGTISLRGRRLGDKVVVTVEDDGPGIPANKLEAIFERFYSERPEGEKFGTHSGLGLSISKQIVEAHQGTLVATNRLAADGSVKGALFTVTLPAG